MYIVYLTIYLGNDMPSYYIGSTTMIQYNKGYLGSVKSKLYRDKFKSARVNSPELFDTVILESLDSRELAFEREKFWQVRVSAHKNPIYINMALAVKDGYCGRTVEGSKNPRYKCSPPQKTKRLYNNGTDILWIGATEDIPKGYVLGNLKNPKCYYTDGHRNYYIEPALADVNWKKGRVHNNLGHNNGKVYYNDGVKNYLIFPSEVKPGLHQGMVSDIRKGKRYYNDGEKNYFCSERKARLIGDLVEGQITPKGRVYKKGRSWYNDGAKSYLIPPTEVKPNYKRGKL